MKNAKDKKSTTLAVFTVSKARIFLTVIKAK